jgi:hypothetical protein
MASAVRELLEVLDLEPLEVNLFRGRSPQSRWQRVFGGQVIGQALVAACRTVDGVADRPPHSLHAYFLLAGDPKVPIVYEVDRIRDGKSFTTRRVIAIQHGHAIFSMSVSFHVHEPGLSHQASMPDVPRPDSLPDDAQLRAAVLAKMPEPVRRYYERERPIDLRPVELDRYLGKPTAEGKFHVWMRAIERLPDEPHPVRAHHDGGEPRPRDVVPSAVPRRRVAALRARQPERGGRTRVCARVDFRRRRNAGCIGGAGRDDQGAAGGTLNSWFLGPLPPLAGERQRGGSRAHAVSGFALPALPRKRGRARSHYFPCSRKPVIRLLGRRRAPVGGIVAHRASRFARLRLFATGEPKGSRS